MCVCYRDMTFCVNYDCELDCDRKLTEEIRKEAIDYSMPICMAEFNVEDCKKRRGINE